MGQTCEKTDLTFDLLSNGTTQIADPAYKLLKGKLMAAITAGRTSFSDLAVLIEASILLQWLEHVRHVWKHFSCEGLVFWYHFLIWLFSWTGLKKGFYEIKSTKKFLSSPWKFSSHYRVANKMYLMFLK